MRPLLVHGSRVVHVQKDGQEPSILSDVEVLDQQVEVFLQGLVVPVPHFFGAEGWLHQVVQEGLGTIVDPVQVIQDLFQEWLVADLFPVSWL
jgi:hypothetical protein